MDRIAYFCIWLFTFTIPWEGSVTIPGFGTGPKGVGTIGKLVGLGAAAIGVCAVLARGRMRPLSLFHILAGCFVIWIGVTSAWSIDPQASAQAFKVALQVGSIPWLLWEFVTTSHRRRLLMQGYVLGAYISVVNILLNYSAGIGTKGHALLQVDTGRYTAEGFNPNAIGLLLLLALPMAWHLSLDHRNALITWINRLYIPLGTVAILLTGSRSSMIGAIIGLSLIPLTLGRLTLSMKALVITLICATLIGGAIIVPEKTLARLGTTTEEIQSGTLNERRVIWAAGMEVFQRHPFRGVGAGTFSEAVEPFLGYQKTAHNTYVSVLVEEGIVGLSLLVLMFITVFLHVRSVDPDERKLLFVLVLCVLIGMLPRAMEYDKPLWLMFGFLLAPPVRAAVAEAFRERLPYKPVQPPRRRSPLPVR